MSLQDHEYKEPRRLRGSPFLNRALPTHFTVDLLVRAVKVGQSFRPGSVAVKGIATMRNCTDDSTLHARRCRVADLRLLRLRRADLLGLYSLIYGQQKKRND